MFGDCIVNDGIDHVTLIPATDTDIQFRVRDCTVTDWNNMTSMQSIVFIGKFNPANDGTPEAQDYLLGVNFSTGQFTADNGWIGSVAEMLRDKPLSCV